MFYYRVYGQKEAEIWQQECETFFKENDIPWKAVEIRDEENPDDPEYVTLEILDENDNVIAAMERDDPSSPILHSELEEFHGLTEEMLPEVNRDWFRKILDNVKICYVFSLDEDVLGEENWDMFLDLTQMIRDKTDGIELSDDGQITNEEGYLALFLPPADDEEDEEDDEKEGDAENAAEEGCCCHCHEHADSNTAPKTESAVSEDSDAEEEEEWDCEAAILVNGEWKTTVISSKEKFDNFLKGELD